MFSTRLRPRYEETDRMGVVYHTNYLVYFEVGRTEFLRALGCCYRTLEESGYVLAVIDCGAKFLKSAAYDDLLDVFVRMTSHKAVRIRLEYEIRRGEELLVTGFTEHAVLRREDMTPTRPPSYLKEALARAPEFDDADTRPAGATPILR